ncbi:MAG: hypothetical protein ABSC77_04635 [Terracidiphilus sp.]|jgi:hypothetical protein
MQTLGLSQESKRSDGWLKSLFWPTVENAWDVDYLGQQGFWICFLLAVIQFGYSLFTGSPLIILLGFLVGLIYFTGGMGVREKCWPAAALIFACYFLETLASMFSGLFLSPGGVLRILLLALLLTNLRATFIASEWKPAAEGEDTPLRFNESLRDKLVDSWPPKLWPRLQIPFYVLAVLLLILSLLEVIALILIRMKILPFPGVH